MPLSDDRIEFWREPARADRHRIAVEPWDPAMLQPASVDLKLGNSFRGFEHAPRLNDEVDLAAIKDITVPFEVDNGGSFLMRHGDFLLATTLERVKVPPSMSARVEGKSSIARLGLAIHVTGGFIDPGFEGQITLEMANLGPRPIRIRPGLPIAQIAFEMVVGDVRRPYGVNGLGSHYQGQTGATESRYGQPVIPTERQSRG